MMKTRNEQEHRKNKYALETYEYHPTFKIDTKRNS